MSEDLPSFHISHPRHWRGGESTLATRSRSQITDNNSLSRSSYPGIMVQRIPLLLAAILSIYASSVLAFSSAYINDIVLVVGATGKMVG
jgi:hypothetical protein